MVSKWVKMWALVGYNAGEHTVVLWYMRFMHGHVAVASWLVYGILGGMGYRVWVHRSGAIWRVSVSSRCHLHTGHEVGRRRG